MKLPFHYNAHSEVVYMIAKGLHDAGFLDTYLELGCKKGKTFNRVAPLAKVAFAIDINKDSYQRIKSNKNLKWHCTKSQDFLKNYNDELKFDMIFIDADHCHESSLEDFKLSLPLLKDNGIILLHDTYPPAEVFTGKGYCFDSYKTAEWIKENKLDEVEVVTLPFYFGITIVRKTQKQLDWK